MIEVDYRKKGKMHDIKITGHASGETGKNIICAGSSMLAYTLAEALMRIDDASVKIKDDGEIFRVTAEDNSKVRDVISTIMTGYELLENEYPQEVSLV